MSDHLNFTILNIYFKKYRETLKHTIEALKILGKIRKDVYHISLMNEIAIHYFLGNTDVVLSKLASYKRIIAKGDIMFGFEKELPTYLMAIFNNPQDIDLYTKLFELLNRSLEEEGKQIARSYIALFYLKPI